jgi:methylglyoxal/glyoxal reductase
LNHLLPKVEIVPMVNQMEFHPYLIQQELVDLCTENNIIYQAWGPLIQGRVFDIPLLKQLGKKYRKNAAQIVLRWNLQKGIPTIPKSTNQTRIISNSEIFDFELTAEEVLLIDGLDKNHRFGYDPMMV